MTFKALVTASAIALSTPSYATDLSFEAIAGGSLQMQGEVGYGNWLTSTLYDQSVQGITPDERLLESFSFFLTTSSTDPLTYRMAVGELDGIRLAGDAWSTDWQVTATGGEIQATIPGGLYLDPTKQYIPYILPAGVLGDVYQWSIDTTLTNRYIGVVGAAPLWYTTTHLVDLDLPDDQDVVMKAHMTTVPEPSILVMLASALFVLAAMGRRKK